jgi:hypothetical protein
MRALVRAEWSKQRSIRTGPGLMAAMVGLVLFAVVLHGFGVAADDLGRNASEQLTRLFSPGQRLAAMFAGLLGALSVTSEFRHGTIRPTLLVTPRRPRVIAAKVSVSMLAGATLGIVACATAAAVGGAALGLRGIDVHLAAGDFALLIAGGAAGAALWAAIGVGLGALIRHQIPTTIGICAWLLFVEGLLVGDVADVDAIGQFAPGAAAAAITGQDPSTLLAPAAGLLLLAIYACALVVTGTFAISQRDID